ncbi:Translation initiation factor eIF-2B subunit beta [Orchesella cincta]|uniref:Translation initiation factor eIF2B subunit beta n=1 Tax=Orchesella cincta TaxID=48709 RepID=A0A1D2N188_ORCCI|nr:Translation initiation factor eIF-2B subunit beta [Orchesella cincta]
MTTASKESQYMALLQQLETSLKRGRYVRSHELATRTLRLAEKYVQSDSWKNAEEVMQWLENTADRLTKAAVSESAPSNVLKRLIKTVQEDFMTRKNKGKLHTISRLDSDAKVDYSEELPDLRSDILGAILDLSSELENGAESIAEDAEKHINANEVIMTIGRSRTVEAFLKRAAKVNKLEVIIVKCGPFYQGKDLAKILSKSKIKTTVVNDTAAFSLMSRVDKIVIGTHTVLANGGLKAIAGCHQILLTSKYFNVPVLVLAASYKLSPEYPFSAEMKITNRFVSPEELIDYKNGQMIDNVQVYAPVFDYVPPELVSLFIFNMGSHAPSYIHRLLHDTYTQG